MNSDHDISLCDRILNIIFPRFCEYLARKREIDITIIGTLLAVAYASPAILATVLQYVVLERRVQALLYEPAILIIFPYTVGWALSVYALSRALLLIPRIFKDVDKVVRDMGIEIDPPIHVKFVREVIHKNIPLTILMLIAIVLPVYAWFFHYYLKKNLDMFLGRPLLLISVVYYATVVFPRTFVWTSRIVAYILRATVELRTLMRYLEQEIHILIERNDRRGNFMGIYMIALRTSALSCLFKKITDFAVWGSFMWIVGLTILIPLIYIVFAELAPLYYGLATSVMLYLVGFLFYAIPQHKFNLFIKKVKRDVMSVVERLEGDVIQTLMNDNVDEGVVKGCVRSYIMLAHLRQEISVKIPDVKPTINKYYIIGKMPLPVISLLISGMVKGSTYELSELIEKIIKLIIDLL